MLRALLAALVGVLTLLAPPAQADPGPVAPEPGRPWFGPALDIRSDTPTAYADRLGATPSLYTFPVDLPLTDEGVDQLQRFATEVAAQGAVLVLQVEPTVDLDDLTAGDHDAVAGLVADLADDPGVSTLVRFAPEMNGSWRPWGQQPESFVAAFRDLADAVHAAEPTAAMVWSPVYGSGYPFRQETGADSEIDLSGSRQLGPLDTDGDGRLGEGDDPYGPYYPGDEAVDWTGLFLYRFGQSQGIRRNVPPPRDELARRLDDRWGYPSPGRASFYDRFSADSGHPLLLETAALHNPAVGGATALELQQRWWRQVFASLADHPMIGAISWLELSREEPEVADEPVDWGVTRTPELAAAFRADLEASPVELGPVTEPREAPPGATGGRAPTEDELQPLVSGTAAGTTAARVAAVLLVLVLLLSALGARRPGWGYADRGERDRRVDLLRGLLLVGTVALHLPVTSALRDVAAGAVALGGAETFVLVSGVCVGLVYPPLAARLGHTAAAGRRFRRAFLIWLAAVTAVLATYVLALLPGLDLDDIGRAGPVDLYAGARRLFDYPPPGWIARDLLGLQLGSWLLVPLALLAALQLLSPLAAGPLARGWWWVVLPVSWGLYALGRWTDAELLPSSSEVIAPILVWQVLFVHGVALGQHRQAVAGALRRPAGAAALAAATAAASAALWLDVAPTGSSADLPLLRLLVVATSAVLAWALLTTCWPAVAAAGIALEPLGRVPLLVVVSQPFVVLVVAALPGVDGQLAGTLVVITVLVLLVLLARWRSAQVPSESPSSSSRSTTARVLTR